MQMRTEAFILLWVGAGLGAGSKDVKGCDHRISPHSRLRKLRAEDTDSMQSLLTALAQLRAHVGPNPASPTCVSYLLRQLYPASNSTHGASSLSGLEHTASSPQGVTSCSSHWTTDGFPTYTRHYQQHNHLPAQPLSVIRAAMTVPTCIHWQNTRGYAAAQHSLYAPEYAVGLHNLRDNPGSRKKRIRLGRGDSARRGNYSGRGMKGLKARGRAHILYDGGQLGLLKFPVTREQPPYEVLYRQLGLSRLVECIQLGKLDHTRVITMKDLQDCGCVGKVEYGVMLYGKIPGNIGFPIHIQVSACDDVSRQAIEAAGGSVTRVYYTAAGLRALLQPEKYLRIGLPFPQPPPSWHPKHDGKFDAVGQLPPRTDLPSEGGATLLPPVPSAGQGAGAAVAAV